MKYVESKPNCLTTEFDNLVKNYVVPRSDTVTEIIFLTRCPITEQSCHFERSEKSDLRQQVILSKEKDLVPVS